MSGKCINDGNWGLTKKIHSLGREALRDFRKMAQQRGRCGWAPPGGVEHEMVAEILTHGGTFVVHTSALSGGDCASRLDVILYQQGIYGKNLQNHLLKLNRPGWQKSPWKALTNNVKSDKKKKSMRNRKRTGVKYGWQELSVFANQEPFGQLTGWMVGVPMWRISGFDTQDLRYDEDFSQSGENQLF